jgi:HTH-type transcriptional regulator/antitoxin HigA
VVTPHECPTLKTKADYKATLAEIDGLMSAKLGTPEGDELDILVTLIEAYVFAHRGQFEFRRCK